MDVLSSLVDGFSIALTFQNLFLAFIGCFLGTIIGALPGLGPVERRGDPDPARLHAGPARRRRR